MNLALSIIYARHLLAALLSEWPEDEVLNAELLDNCDEVQLIGLMDIVQRMEGKDTFEKVKALSLMTHSRTLYTLSTQEAQQNYMYMSILLMGFLW